MLKYCNGCKRDLEIDNFYSYKKSTCKDCINKKVKCEYCHKEFNSTNLSKHMKQIHGTSNKTKSISTSNNSTSIQADKNISTSEITLSDQLYVSTYPNTLKNKHISYDQNDIDKINKILAINRKLNDKIENGTINAKEKNQFANNLKKLQDM